MCISIKITIKLTFANILQKHFNLSNEFVISAYYLCFRFLRIRSLKAGFRYNRVSYKRVERMNNCYIETKYIQIKYKNINF
jgi:hypothetical protein